MRTPRRHAEVVPRPCGVHHAITDDKTARRVFTRLVRELGPDVRLNLGVVAHPLAGAFVWRSPSDTRPAEGERSSESDP